jgi:hypothetical protein
MPCSPVKHIAFIFRAVRQARNQNKPDSKQGKPPAEKTRYSIAKGGKIHDNLSVTNVSEHKTDQHGE